jgi:hypothetical protein
MRARQATFPLFLAVLLSVQLACSRFAGPSVPDTAATLEGLYTASAQTMQALETQAVFTSTPGLPPPTSVATPFPAQASSTPIILSPAPPPRCDAAAFEADVTYPDGSLLARGASFTKTWRLRNTGTCSWNSSYALVFYSGEPMSAPSWQALPHSVVPGQTVDLSVALKAPTNDGQYRGHWKLRNPANVLFGIGAQADTAFWVDIKVSGPSHVAYDFVAKYCSADWENNNTSLPCPGDEGDGKGYVVRLNHPKLENGDQQDRAALLTFPRDTSNGQIRGQYPAFKLETGDRFRARLYCRHGAAHCNVIFRLEYLNNGQVRTLGSWNEAYEGGSSAVDLNLGSLAGETVKFIFVVLANGSANDDEAIWLDAHIRRQGTATATATVTPTGTATRTPTTSATPSPTASPTASPTPSSTPTATPTGTASATPTPTDTATASL